MVFPAKHTLPHTLHIQLENKTSAHRKYTMSCFQFFALRSQTTFSPAHQIIFLTTNIKKEKHKMLPETLSFANI